MSAVSARRSEIRDPAAAARWLSAGVSLARVTPMPSPVDAAAWIVTTLGETPGLAPPGVIVDLGALLLGATIDARAVMPADPQLARLLPTYEHQVLGRLVGDKRLEACGDAIARLPVELRAAAVAVTAASIFHRAGFEEGVAISPASVRRFALESTAESGFDALRRDEQARMLLARGYEALISVAQRTRTLLVDADVFTLEHLTVLESLAQRVALEDVLAAESALLLDVPRRFAKRTRARGTVATQQIEEEDIYPVGGFSSITNAGSFENLVTSELVYLEEPSPGDENAIDLFDVRFTQGELLYYTRDEATFVRPHRMLSFVFDEDFVDARCKDRDLAWQRSVLCIAIVHATFVRLLDELGDEDFRIRLVFPHGSALDDERALLAVLSREQEERGVLEIARATLDEELVRAEEASRRGIAQVVRCSSHAAPLPSTRKSRVERYELSAEGRSLEAWRALLLDLLRRLP